MADVVILGAGLVGLGTAMLLARDGHQVTVLERDAAPPPVDADVAWSDWDRRGVNHFRMPHFLLPRWRHLMERELPDVLATLREEGALVYNPLSSMRAKHTGGWVDGDERFESVTARRPMLESVLARAAAAEPGVLVCRDVTVRALPTLVQGSEAPRVLGVLVDPAELITCDLVVDATGRRSRVPALVTDTRQPPVDHREEAGFVYLSRHFRATGTSGIPEPAASLVQNYRDLTILTLPSDHDTWSVSMVISTHDRDLLGLRELAAWSMALGLFPAAAHWADGEPISEVNVMAGIEDRIRYYVPDGQASVTGLLAVGDAWACTNPSLGHGTSLGFEHACALRDLLHATPEDPEQLALEWDRRTRTYLEPTYRWTVNYDRHRLREIEAHRKGLAYETDDPMWADNKALTAAAPTNPHALRGLLDLTSLLASQDEVLGRPEIAGQLDRNALPRPLPGPERSELLAAAGV